MHKKIKPIFIIGRHRSGTTWLANILASLPEVYTPTHKLHQGQHESAFFSSLLPYCYWGETNVDLLALKSIFERSDYFYLLGLSSKETPDILDVGIAEYFRGVMDKVAQKESANFWVEKTPAHTLKLGILMKMYPDAYFIAVTRNDYDIIRSIVYKFSRPNLIISWLKASVVTEIYKKIIFNYKENLYTVRYEDLQNNYEDTVNSLMEYIGIVNNIPYSNFKKNSSYKQSSPKIKWWQKFTIKIGKALMSCFPPNLIEIVIIFREKIKRSKLPTWYFKITSGKF